jgi:hypothetical protein
MTCAQVWTSIVINQQYQQCIVALCGSYFNINQVRGHLELQSNRDSTQLKTTQKQNWNFFMTIFMLKFSVATSWTRESCG